MLVRREREVWRPVVGYEGKYEVSNLGRFRRIGGRAREKVVKYYLLKGSITVYGYNHIVFHRDGKQKSFRSARIVMQAFRGPCPAGMEVLHRNSRRTDDRLCNLRYGTRADNELDKVLAGTSNRGERHGMAKLAEASVRRIRILLIGGVTQKSIAKRFNVNSSTISAISRGILWKHL